jgi:hypothetical protein
MANFWGNFVSLMGVPVFYFQNLVTLLMKRKSSTTWKNLYRRETLQIPVM